MERNLIYSTLAARQEKWNENEREPLRIITRVAFFDFLGIATKDARTQLVRVSKVHDENKRKVHGADKREQSRITKRTTMVE